MYLLLSSIIVLLFNLLWIATCPEVLAESYKFQNGWLSVLVYSYALGGLACFVVWLWKILKNEKAAS